METPHSILKKFFEGSLCGRSAYQPSGPGLHEPVAHQGVKIMVIVLFALAALGIEYGIYYTGMLKEHMTFLEFLLLISRS